MLAATAVTAVTAAASSAPPEFVAALDPASLQRLLPQAEQGLRDGDHPAVRHVAHTLKSSSASVGALELSRRCADIENRVRTQQHDGLAERVAALQAEGQRVLEAVRGLLSE